MQLTNLFLKDIREGFNITWNAGKKYALYNLVLSVLLALLPLASLWYIKEIIDLITNYGSAAKEDFVYAVLSLVIIQLLQAALQHLQNDIQTVQQQLCIDYLTSKVLEKAVKVQYPYYENANYYNSLHQAQQEVIYKTGLLTSGYNQVMQSSLSLIFIAVLFLQFNWIYGVIVILAGLPVLYIKWKHAKAVQKMEWDNLLNERKANYLNRVLTDAAHAKEVRTYFFGEFFIEKFNDLRQSIFAGRKKLSSNQAKAETLIQSIEIIMLAVIVYHLGSGTMEGKLSAGGFIFYFQALQRLQSGFRNFLTGFTLLFRQRYFLKNLSAFFGLPLKPAGSANTGKFPASLGNGIVLREVSFAYPDIDRLVLKGVNMRFEPGKITAIIGENGSGKSTLVKLLARLYAPAHGLIEAGGTDIDDIGEQEYYQNVSLLFQDYNQYHFSLADNIMLGGQYDQARLISAAMQADLTATVDDLPAQFDTALGKMFGNDMQLSGGQWQKIAIARMLYRNTPVMIMDEPTSNIDPLAEYEILSRIAAGKKDKIIILITHRLHNLKFADHVYIMEHGKVHGGGSVPELLSGDELFRQMYERQDISSTKV